LIIYKLVLALAALEHRYSTVTTFSLLAKPCRCVFTAYIKQILRSRYTVPARGQTEQAFCIVMNSMALVLRRVDRSDSTTPFKVVDYVQDDTKCTYKNLEL